MTDKPKRRRASYPPWETGIMEVLPDDPPDWDEVLAAARAVVDSVRPPHSDFPTEFGVRVDLIDNLRRALDPPEEGTGP